MSQLNARIICFPVGRPRDTPEEPTGTQGEWHSLDISLFPLGKGSCLVLETTSLDHGDIQTGFVRLLVSVISICRPRFLASFYFISVPNFDISCWGVHTSPREGLFVTNFMPFFVCQEKQFPGQSRGSNHVEANDKCIQVLLLVVAMTLN